MNIEVTETVKDRYSSGAAKREAELCCPIDYDPKYLEVIPAGVIERDYGCGDPSQYVREGEVVLDLGSGTGKICFIASQIVGAEGRVIGVDMTEDMLAVANAAAPVVAERIGYANVEFRRGQIQDLRTDLDVLDAYVKESPVKSAEDYQALQSHMASARDTKPLVADDSVDVVVSNCVLNLVDDSLKRDLFAEMFRVLKRGGRIAISDIVSDEASPPHLKDDPELWSGCVSGALVEHEFVQLLEEIGFYGITVDKWDDDPWQVVEGIEYRSMTILAWKGKEGACVEKNEAVIYKGPWKTVEDDDGHVYHRGRRMAVCEKTFGILTKEPYVDHVIPVLPNIPVAEEAEFDCSRPTLRDPRETKTGVPKVTVGPKADCC